MKEIEILYGYIEADTGYGISAKSLMGMLSKIKGVNVDPLPLNLENVQKEKKLKDKYDIFINHTSAGTLINDVANNGYLKMVLGRCKKKYQYVLWEADRLPAAHTKFFQEPHINGFICPSHFMESLVKDFKGKESHYIPITQDNINYSPDMRLDDDTFSVLVVAQMSVRKAIDVSVCAFTTAFYGHPNDVRMYVKIGEKIDGGQDVGNIIKANINRSMLPNHGNIFLIEENLPDHDLEKLYLDSNCYLHLSRGEGFGMTPLTALNYGLPVVYSDWSAHKEFLDKSTTSEKVGGRIDYIHSMDKRFGFEPEMKWFECSLVEAVAGLRKVYSKWKDKKLKYTVPKVVNEYKEEVVMKNVADFLKIKDVEFKNISKVGGLNVVEF